MRDYLFRTTALINLEEQISDTAEIDAECDISIFLSFLYGSPALFKDGGHATLNTRLRNIHSNISEKQDVIIDALALGNTSIKRVDSGRLGFFNGTEKVAELSSAYDLKIKGIIYNDVDALDINSQTDEKRTIDGSTNINTEDSLSSFVSFLFGVPVTQKNVDKFSIDGNGNLFAKTINNDDVFRVFKDGSIDINNISENQQL